MTGDRLSLSILAKALGISKTAVHKRGRRGMPVDSVEAARAWSAEHVDLVRSRGAALGMGAAQDDDDDAPEAGDLADYRQARAHREQIRRDREQIELDKLRGNVVDLAEVNRLVFTGFRALRDAVENVPLRIAAQCAAETDASRVEALITEELAQALRSVDPARLLRDVDDDEEDDG